MFGKVTEKHIPYGMMNFAVIRRGDCYYVDKTRFIPNQVARKQIYTYLNGFISKL